MTLVCDPVVRGEPVRPIMQQVGRAEVYIGILLPQECRRIILLRLCPLAESWKESTRYDKPKHFYDFIG